MSSIGLPELLVILIIGLVLFGAPVLTFFVGYFMGRNRSGEASTDSAGKTPKEATDDE